MSCRWRIALALTVLCSLLAMPAGASAAIPMSIDVRLGDSCLSGTGARHAEVVATLRTPSGELRDRFRTHADRWGWWSGCFAWEFTDLSTYINGGDRLRVVVGAEERAFVVPQLIPQIDRVRDTIKGSAPALADVNIYIDHHEGFELVSSHELATAADAAGHFAYDTTSILDLRGRDMVVVWTQDGNVTFTATRLAPYIQLGHANHRVLGSANRGLTLRLVLTDSDGNVKARKTHRVVAGSYELSMTAANGSAAYPVGRDWLLGNFADDATLHVPVSQLAGTAVDDVVVGQCMADAPYELTVRYRSFYGTTDATGRLTRDVSSKMNVRKGDGLLLKCMYPSGDVWQRVSMAR